MRSSVRIGASFALGLLVLGGCAKKIAPVPEPVVAAAPEPPTPPPPPPAPKPDPATKSVMSAASCRENPPRAPNVGAAAVLARLYELARYAPLDEPLGEPQLAEARRILCRLAGVAYP